VGAVGSLGGGVGHGLNLRFPLPQGEKDS